MLVPGSDRGASWGRHIAPVHEQAISLELVGIPGVRCLGLDVQATARSWHRGRRSCRSTGGCPQDSRASPMRQKKPQIRCRRDDMLPRRRADRDLWADHALDIAGVHLQRPPAAVLRLGRARRSPARTRSAMRLRSRWAMVKTAWSSGEPVLYATFRRHYGERMPTQRGSELRRFASLDPSLFGESDCPRPEALRGTIPKKRNSVGSRSARRGT